MDHDVPSTPMHRWVIMVMHACMRWFIISICMRRHEQKHEFRGHLLVCVCVCVWAMCFEISFGWEGFKED